MDKWQALHSFWASFGMETYDESTVPDSAGFPRLTYEAATGSILDGPRSMSSSLWYQGNSWAGITLMADHIADYIGMGGIVRLYDGGALWIKRGTPFAQRMSDPDKTIRRIVLNIEAEFLSAN